MERANYLKFHQWLSLREALKILHVLHLVGDLGHIRWESGRMGALSLSTWAGSYVWYPSTKLESPTLYGTGYNYLELVRRI